MLLNCCIIWRLQQGRGRSRASWARASPPVRRRSSVTRGAVRPWLAEQWQPGSGDSRGQWPLEANLTIAWPCPHSCRTMAVATLDHDYSHLALFWACGSCSGARGRGRADSGLGLAVAPQLGASSACNHSIRAWGAFSRRLRPLPRAAQSSG